MPPYPDEMEKSASKHVTFESRLQSFHQDHLWPFWTQLPTALAKAGFYWCKRENDNSFTDRVACFSCGLVLGDWQFTDIAIFEHFRHNMFKCEFLIETFKSTPLNEFRTEHQAIYPSRLMPLRLVCKPLNKRVQRTFRGPAFKMYNSVDARERSFKKYPPGWDESIFPKAETMANAGFYYESTGHARCFSCGNVVRNLTADTDPIKLHLELFPQCFYSYVKKVGVVKAEKVDDECICVENKADIVCVDCCHKVGCAECVAMLEKCPTCRAYIKNVFKIY